MTAKKSISTPSLLCFAVLLIFALLHPAPLSAAPTAAPTAPPAVASPAQSRFPLLSRGINVSWLGYYVRTGKFVLNREAAQRDLDLIKAAGCRHVRLVFNIDELRDDATPGTPDPKKLPQLDAAIDLVLASGLAAIVDPFHYGKDGLLQFPGPKDPGAEVMVRFWSALAKHLAATDPERVFLEVANEPALDNPLDWYAVELRIMKAIRQAAPRHTIILGYNLKSSPSEWDSVKALTQFPAVGDANVVYNFHFYEPMDMTHQGASWAWKYGALNGVPYPSRPELIKPLLAGITDKELRGSLSTYGEKRWGKALIDSKMAAVAAWVRSRGALVTCNEFGVYNKVAPPAARAAWTRDVREALEKYSIGWTIWESEFGFFQHKGSQLVVDEPIIKALGLKMP